MSSRSLPVVGVMPPGFEYPEQTQIWVNSAVNLSEEPRDNRAWSAIARLNSNVDLKRAQSRVSAINAQLDNQFHETNKGWDVSLWTLHERLVREVKPSLLALLDETYSRGEWLADCSRIRCPVLVIAGSDDTFPTLEMSTRVAAVIEDARLHVVAGGPHFPNRSHRGEVQSVIGAFFAAIGIVPREMLTPSKTSFAAGPVPTR